MTEQTKATLDDLVGFFDVARAAVLKLAEPYDPNRTTCRYCGKHWRRWTGSILDGHAKCMVTPEFKRAVKVAMERDVMLTYLLVGKALNVSPSIVRSWTYPIRGVS